MTSRSHTIKNVQGLQLGSFLALLQRCLERAAMSYTILNNFEFHTEKSIPFLIVLKTQMKKVRGWRYALNTSPGPAKLFNIESRTGAQLLVDNNV